MRRHRGRVLVGIVLVLVVTLGCALVFLANNAPRDWSLHWYAAHAASVHTADADLAAVSVPGGWEAVWLSEKESLVDGRFNAHGHLLSQTSIPGQPQNLTVAHTSSESVAAWRQDINGGSTLRIAVFPRGGGHIEREVVRAVWPLEHPYAFPLGGEIGMVFSWQVHDVFNIYFTRISPTGRFTPPVPLTNVPTYAFNPRAVAQGPNTFALLFMNSCCGQKEYHVTYRRFTAAGTPVGGARVLDTFAIGSDTEGSTPNRWGEDMRTDGTETWTAWAGSGGLMVAVLHGDTITVRPRVVVPFQTTDALALALVGSQRELVWDQAFPLGMYLATVSLSPTGTPLGEPDRVAFEAASDAYPQPVTLNGHPAVVWLASPTKSPYTLLETARFTPTTITAPSVWQKLGLGLANPLLNLLVLIIGALAVGLLLAVVNILMVFALIAVYFVLSRLLANRWKWVAYITTLAVGLYWLFATLNAPDPPIIFLTGLSGVTALVAIAGMVVVLVVLGLTILRRMEDFYRAALMAFVSLYFIAFLQALITVQGQIGKI